MDAYKAKGNSTYFSLTPSATSFTRKHPSNFLASGSVQGLFAVARNQQPVGFRLRAQPQGSWGEAFVLSQHSGSALGDRGCCRDTSLTYLSLP